MDDRTLIMVMVNGIGANLTNVAGCGVHEMDLLARDAGDCFIGRFIGLHFLGGPALDVLACVRASIKKRRHRGTTNRFNFARFELNQKPEQVTGGRSYPKKMAPVFGASFRFSLLVLFSLVATALLARDHAAIVAFDGRGHHAAISPWANGYAARANADSGV
jgi:hypothetical protein